MGVGRVARFGELNMKKLLRVRCVRPKTLICENYISFEKSWCPVSGRFTPFYNVELKVSINIDIYIAICFWG